MSGAAFVAFVIASVFAFIVAVGSHITTHDPAWAFFFVALGLALDHLPAVTVRRGP